MSSNRSKTVFTFIGVVFMAISTFVNAGKARPGVVPIEHWQMKNGVNVYFVPMHEIPIVDIGVVFNAGSSQDGENAGLATMTNAMLDEGTQKHSADQIAQALEDVGALFNSSVELDYATIQLRSMADSAFLEPAVSVFSEMINNPTFPVADFNRLKEQMLRSLQEQEQEPGTIAEQTFFETVFHGGAYSKPSLGKVETVRQLTPDVVRKFYQQHYTAANAHIIVVGDIKRAQAEKLAQKILGALPLGEKLPAIAESNITSKSETKNIRFPSSQTHILIGQRAISRSSPDYFSLVVGNQILGGGVLTSRLYKSVREKAGLAYSVYSYFDALKMSGPFLIGMQTRNEQASTAIKITLDTLSTYVDQGPTDDELTEAKNNIINGFALRLASNRAILSNVMNITTYGLPLNYLDTYRDNINAVTSDSIKAAFHRHVNPKSLVTITVGNNTF